MMDSGMESVRKEFVRRVRKFAATRRHIANATSCGAALTWAAVTGIVCLLLLSGWIRNAFVNAGLFTAGACVLLVILVRFLRQLERRRSDLREALGMEMLAGGLNSRLISALDFLGWQRQTELTRHVIACADADLKTPFESMLDRQPLRRTLKRCGLALVLFIGLGFTPWFSFARLAATWQQSWFAVHEALFPTRYTLTPPAGRPCIKKVGADVLVSIRFSRKGYSNVVLADRVKDQTVATALEVDGTLTAQTTLKSPSESEHRLRFEFGKRSSEEITVIFTLPPALVNMQTELIYPTYTRLLPKDLEGIQDRITGLQGTKITVGFTFSKELESATLTWDTGEKVPLDVVGRFASVSLIHTRPGRATLDVNDVHGFSLERPHAIQFDVLNDEPPRLFVPGHLKQNMPQLAEQFKAFGFGVRAEDDFGITRVVLKWTRATTENPDEVLEKNEFERLITPPRQKVTVEFLKVFENVAVKPGDLIGFQFVAYDNREPNRQQVSSASFSIFIHQADLDGMSGLDDPAFGGVDLRRPGRLGKSRLENTVGEPTPLKTKEQVQNEFDAVVPVQPRLPTVRGSNSGTVRHYFEALAPVKFNDKEE